MRDVVGDIEVWYDAEAEVFVGRSISTGIYSQGETKAEAVEATKSAVRLHAEVREQRCRTVHDTLP